MRRNLPDMKARIPFVVIVLLLIAWGLLTIRIDAPWFGHHDWHGTRMQATVENYYRYDAADVKFLQVRNVEPTSPGNFYTYINHPPMVAWGVALVSLPIGVSELSVRFAAISVTMLGLAAFYALNRLHANARQAKYALALLMVTPIMAYYGRLPEYVTMSVPLILMYALIVSHWQHRPIARYWWILAGFTVLVVWTDWAAMVGVSGLLAISFWKGTARLRRAIVMLGIIGLAATVGLLTYYTLANPSGLADLVSIFQQRVGNQAYGESFSWFDFGLRTMLRLIAFATPGVVLLSVVGVLRLRHGFSVRGVHIIDALLITGLGYIVVFRNAAYIHDFFVILVTPPVVMLAASALSRHIEQRGWQGIGYRLIGFSVLVTSIPVLIVLHASGDRSCRMEVAKAISAHTDSDDQVVTNLPYISPAIEFYAFRNIQWNVSPSEALDYSSGNDSDHMYAYCPNINIDTCAAQEPVNESCQRLEDAVLRVVPSTFINGARTYYRALNPACRAQTNPSLIETPSEFTNLSYQTEPTCQIYVLP